ncbi:hypothetical protein [Streptacidiphilus albus]|uniref:hypothetical protein n=1 Tax=Streptacidiphilus albus TaxID=105425 RepID=UPI00054C7A54|nr:hypothetical protein [Streptacidiphilus albus]
MTLEALRDHFHWLESVVIRTDLQPSEAVIQLRSKSAGATLRLVGVLHARADFSGPDCDFVDEVVVRELPQHGPWPAEARHLLQHHNNRCVLQWLTIIGPSEVEILAEEFSDN